MTTSQGLKRSISTANEINVIVFCTIWKVIVDQIDRLVAALAARILQAIIKIRVFKKSEVQRSTPCG